ncbi:MAG: DUF6261 family protein [Prevotellaceae bacterium]|jgi:hypothetical protein|nr:DUF6261 family protein [Prevotellaceae bacterium]
MKKILTARLVHYRNEAHCEYMITFRSRVSADADILELLETELPPFDAKLAQEKALIDTMRKSDYTRLIATTDKLIDKTVVGMREIVNAQLRNPNAAIVEAAISLKNRFDAYGRIEKKPYEEEQLAVDLLIADLNGAYATKVTSTGLSGWVMELQLYKTRFESYFALRQAEISRRPEGKLSDVRKEIDPLYRQLVEKVDAASLIGTLNADAFITVLNTDITYFNEHTYRRAKKDLDEGDHTVIDAIDTQDYTGTPIIVIPKVFYREKEKPTKTLILGTDFDVTYKNNINVGTAELTIHGKGAYKGKKSVTFNIKRVC